MILHFNLLDIISISLSWRYQNPGVRQFFLLLLYCDYFLSNEKIISWDMEETELSGFLFFFYLRDNFEVILGDVYKYFLSEINIFA